MDPILFINHIKKHFLSFQNEDAVEVVCSSGGISQGDGGFLYQGVHSGSLTERKRNILFNKIVVLGRRM